MDDTALFKITYGMFAVCAKENDKQNGCIVNTVLQVSSAPARIIVTINKDTLTHDMIKNTGVFCASILSESTEINLIAGFGFRSGRTADKFEHVIYKTDENGIPYLSENAVAFISAKVFDTTDVGTHTTFFADVTNAQTLTDENPMTYAYYRQVKNGKTSKFSPLTHS